MFRKFLFIYLILFYIFLFCNLICVGMIPASALNCNPLKWFDNDVEWHCLLSECKINRGRNS